MTVRDSLSKKLTAMNMLVSGGALLLACSAFFAYDLITFRSNLVANTSMEAQIVSANAASPLIFNDAKSAESTLVAFRASTHIIYAGIYAPDARFVAGYWRDRASEQIPLPPFSMEQQELSWFGRAQFNLVRTIVFQGKPVGIVYIQSDLGVIDSRLRSYAIIFATILIGSLIAALVLSRIFQRAITKPILGLAETARAVSREKNYSARVAPTGDHDEIGVLVDAFNEMLHEIQQRDADLQEREAQFRTLADSIPQLAWMADADGNLLWYNQRWYEYTGTSPERMLGWGWESIHDPAVLPVVREKWRASIQTGQPFDMIFPLRGADGLFRTFLTLARPVRDGRGKIVRWFGTNTDITEKERSEEALRQTEKLAATGRLAASIAHEINNPLETVTNLVYLARIQPANTQKYLKLADQELDRIAQITKNTLGFYRDTASPSTVDVSQALKEVVALYSRRISFKRITLQADYGGGIQISGYPGEIRQIFANLVANAIDATTDAGCLQVKARPGPAWGDSGKPGVHVTLLDNGTGISPEQRKRIFEPFYTTKKNVGTGLGLWLTLRLVQKHQGSIRVRSSMRTGRTWTAFSVFLPKSVPVSSDLQGNPTVAEVADAAP